MPKLIVTTPEELEQIIARILNSKLPEDSRGKPSKEKQILNIDEASELLGIPKNTLYGYTSRRKIPHQKVGRSLTFIREELIDWLIENQRKTAKQIQNES